MSRPELGPLAEGDEVIVVLRRPHGRVRRAELIPARVVKAARVWIEIDSLDGQDTERAGWMPKRTWRMRRDTQNEGHDSYYQARFVTPAQHEYEQREQAARDLLNELGIELRSNSPWCPIDRRMQLADLIRAAMQSEQQD